MPNKSEELVSSNVLKESLSPEGRATVDQMVAEASPRIEFVKSLRESMGLSHAEFGNLLIEHGGSIGTLPLWAILDNVESRGGKVEVNITF